jgi:lipopolysaccharide export LptBFGC system permease protein LptF
VPSILLKYFLKRWSLPLFGALLFYGGLLMAFEVVGVSKEIFSAGAPFRWMIPLLLLSMPDNLGNVLPMAAVLGGMLGTQQLTEGSEMVAAQGLGVGLRALVKPWLILSGVLLVLATLNAHLVIPWANATQEATQAAMLEEARTRFLRPGSPPWFPKANPQAAVWMGPDGQVHLMEVTPDSVQHLVAHTLTWSENSQGVEVPQISLQMEGLRGAVYHKADGSVGLMQEKEHRYTIEVPRVPHLFESTHARFQSTSHLLKSKTPEALVELSRRFTLPIASCALLLLGIALGLGHPRFQKGGAIVKSLGVILLYYLIMKFFENRALLGNAQGLSGNIALFLLPWLFLGGGSALLTRKLKPHQANRLANCKATLALRHFFQRELALLSVFHGKVLARPLAAVGRLFKPETWKSHRTERRILGTWTRNLWLRNWAGVLATFLVLSLLIEYAGLAGDLAKNHVSIFVFLRYWLWNLPPFLAVVLPLAFLLGGVLTLSDAAVSQEWVALRAGGVSFIQWCGSAFTAWGGVLLFTFLLQTFLAPPAFERADAIYQKILARPARAARSSPWLNLGSTGAVWFLDGNTRWGFPLKPVGQAPILLKWEMGDTQSLALPWNALNLVPGMLAVDLFPDRALRESASAESTPTLDLFHWQKWAPDPERATMLWGRILNWLAGPCLLFGALAFAFPPPRGGRGQALGLSLVVGLAFMGLQALFTGAAKAGEFPSLWGVLCPMVLLMAFGMMRLHRLRT